MNFDKKEIEENKNPLVIILNRILIIPQFIKAESFQNVVVLEDGLVKKFQLFFDKTKDLYESFYKDSYAVKEVLNVYNPPVDDDDTVLDLFDVINHNLEWVAIAVSRLGGEFNEKRRTTIFNDILQESSFLKDRKDIQGLVSKVIEVNGANKDLMNEFDKKGLLDKNDIRYKNIFLAKDLLDGLMRKVYLGFAVADIIAKAVKLDKEYKEQSCGGNLLTSGNLSVAFNKEENSTQLELITEKALELREELDGLILKKDVIDEGKNKILKTLIEDLTDSREKLSAILKGSKTPLKIKNGEG